nr:immunoglobulin light chain junction region [Macaca mulatta]
CVQAIVFPFTF